MDPRLAGQYSIKGAREMALLALQCVSENPRDRPKMPSIIDTLESLHNLKDMAVTYGQWPANPKSTNRASNGVSLNKPVVYHKKTSNRDTPTKKI